ncbi:MAG TPA: glycosyltransferase family protein [Methanothrix sp.]|nr:glycosyltransferase family protein [Methanothrix sp.]
MNPVALIQARMGSTRLPGKVLMPILGKPMLWHIVKRVSYVKGLKGTVVATSDAPEDEAIRRFCIDEGIQVFAGSRDDVLDRIYRAASLYRADPILRITGDCPLVDPKLVGSLLKLYESGSFDHMGIATGAGAVFMKGGRFPDGLDAECFSFPALERAWMEATDPRDREHVTSYIWRQPKIFRLGVLESDEDFSRMRWTVDNVEDLKLISKIYEVLYTDERPFLMRDVLKYFSEHPELAELNREFIGKEGYEELWKIPGLNELKKEP